MTEQDQFIDVLLKTQRAVEYMKDWHANVERWQKLYDMAHYPKAAGQRETQYSDPTFTNTVDLAVGIMLANQLRWHAFGFTPTHKEQRDTGKIEKLLEGILSSNDEREERYQRFELFQNFVRDGGGILYSVFDPEIADRSRQLVNEPSPEGTSSRWVFSEVPVCVKVINPLKFFALPGGPKRWLLMGRKETMSVLDVELLYGVRIEKYGHLTENERANTLGEFMDVWDWVTVQTPVTDNSGVPAYNRVLGKPETTKSMAVRNTLIFDGIPLRGPAIMNGYKDLPYKVQFYKPTGADPKKWQSILSPLEDSVTLLERSFNRRAYQIDVYTGLPLVTKTQPGRKINIDPGLYNSVSISPDESIEFPTWPGNAPDLQMHMEFLRSRIQQSGFSDVMFGQGNGDSAGYAMAQLGDQNRIRLEQPIKHIELLFTAWAKQTLGLLESFAGGVSICVYGHQKGVDYFDYVKVEDFDGYQIRAEVRPTFPNEEQRKVAMASQVKGMMSNYKILEKYLGEEQPEDEEQRMFIEKVTQHPASVQYAVMKELKKRADAGDEVAAMTMQSMQGNVAGQQGRPKDAPSPMQPMGMPSADGQPISQAVGGPVAGQSAQDVQSNMANQAPSLMG
jgi:hypothetical protein